MSIALLLEFKTENNNIGNRLSNKEQVGSGSQSASGSGEATSVHFLSLIWKQSTRLRGPVTWMLHTFTQKHTHNMSCVIFAARPHLTNN